MRVPCAVKEALWMEDEERGEAIENGVKFGEEEEAEGGRDPEEEMEKPRGLEGKEEVKKPRGEVGGARVGRVGEAGGEVACVVVSALFLLFSSSANRPSTGLAKQERQGT